MDYSRKKDNFRLFGQLISRRDTLLSLKRIPCPSFIRKRLDLAKKIDPDLNTNLLYQKVLLTSTIWMIIVFFSLWISLSFMNTPTALLRATVVGFVVFLLFLGVNLLWPSVQVKKRDNELEHQLVFSLKELSLELTAGRTLVEAMDIVSKKNDYPATMFKLIIDKVKFGKNVETALEEVKETYSSAYVKRVIWQLKNAYSSGANTRKMLSSIVNDLVNDQKIQIEKFSKELNLWTLLFMMFAVAIPSIGVTILVVMSGIASFPLSHYMILMFISCCVLVQITLVGWIKSKRPRVSA